MIGEILHATVTGQHDEECALEAHVSIVSAAEHESAPPRKKFRRYRRF